MYPGDFHESVNLNRLLKVIQLSSMFIMYILLVTHWIAAAQIESSLNRTIGLTTSGAIDIMEKQFTTILANIYFALGEMNIT